MHMHRDRRATPPCAKIRSPPKAVGISTGPGQALSTLAVAAHPLKGGHGRPNMPRSHWRLV